MQNVAHFVEASMFQVQSTIPLIGYMINAKPLI